VGSNESASPSSASRCRRTTPTRITPGQTLANPVTGERFTFTHTAGSTNGELLAFDFALRPGGAVPVPHVDPIQTERFEVVDGHMRFRIGLRTVLAGPGDVVEVAPGVAHSFANAGAQDARLRSVCVQRALLAPLVVSARHPRRAQLTTALVAAAALGLVAYTRPAPPRAVPATRQGGACGRRPCVQRSARRARLSGGRRPTRPSPVIIVACRPGAPANT
jgi:mannose-6-phosphate isomerase-like protein (cupin superfamily)